MKTKHTQVIPFDASERSRAQSETFETALKEYAAKAEKVQQRVARELGVTMADLEANSGDLYYHSDEILDVEAAYRKGAREGRTALIAALKDYHKNGYEAGTDDGLMLARTGRA
jgi:hypothetical protein